MTKKEFTQLLSNVIEQKITELFGDLDDNLVMKENIRKRLIRQKNTVARGERGEDFTIVRKRLGL
jgi:hypothetical protein